MTKYFFEMQIFLFKLENKLRYIGNKSYFVFFLNPGKFVLLCVLIQNNLIVIINWGFLKSIF